MTKEPVEPLFINPEQSWLSFNERVFACAKKSTFPLLERLRFLSIAANNLDEFFMVRLGKLYDDLHNHNDKLSIDGLTVAKQIKRALPRAIQQMNDHVELWRVLRKELRHHGIDVISRKDLNEQTFTWLENYFLQNIFPVLTPMAIDPAHPVPLIPSQGIAIIVQLMPKKDQTPVYALIPLPNQLNRFVEISEDSGRRYLMLEHVIVMFVEHLFSDYTVVAQGIFRIIRNSEMEVDHHVTDLRVDYEEALSRRLHGKVVQITMNARMPGHLRLYVAEQFDFNEKEIMIIDGILGINDLSQLISDDYPNLQFPEFTPRLPQRIRHNNYDMFDSIGIKDILVHHPYESFETVLMFLRQAAKDAKVIAIKQTLYRTGDNSPIISTLIEAAKAGKSVTVLVEIKARFDEETNIRWTKDLETAGVHVIYGIVGLKTHGKLTLIMRKENSGLKTYAHFSTGNYNAKTARIYTDLSLFTADPTLTHDTACIFNYITGYAAVNHTQKIAIAPFNLRQNLVQLIDEEITFAQNNKGGCIWAKMNSLTDKHIIEKLYEASCAGVKIELVIRGMCSLKPGVKGLSENIQVKSIVGRFLEHSRIICFGNGCDLPSTDAKVFISSADWMTRNLNWRLELLIPVENTTVKQQILEQIMFANLKDTENSWLLQKDGSYVANSQKENSFDATAFFLQNQSLSGNGFGPYPLAANTFNA